MYNGKKILALVLARGGSKRLPKKNLMELGGKPLIAWSIEAAKKSKYIDEVVFSSESMELIKVAKEYGAQVPFVRPAELAEDETKSIDVITHAIDNIDEDYDEIIILQPTSPLRDEYDIDSGIEFFYKKNATSVIGVCEAEHSPLWSNTLDNSLKMDDFLDEKYTKTRGQDLPTYYRINGAFYMSNIGSVLKNNNFYIKENIYAYVMSQEHSVDIDTKLDFLVAQALLNEKG